MHNIVASSAVNMVDVRLSGVLIQADIDMLEAQLIGHFETNTLRDGYLILADIADCAIQSQATLMAFMAMVGRMPKAQRIAVITGCVIVTMQLMRVMKQPYLRIVRDRQSALAWLVREVEPAIAA